MSSVSDLKSFLTTLQSKVRSRTLHIRHRLGRKKLVAASCPVCQNIEATQFRYPSFGTPGEEIPPHNKYRCRSCGHMFTRWLPPNIDDIGDLYSRAYDTHEEPEANPRKEIERVLLNESMEECGKNGCYLDFSCGNNYEAVLEARSKGHNIFGCDIRESFPADQEGLFQYHPEMNRSQDFDAIVSVDAVEHIQNIESAWKFFNKSLKEGGLMLHSFPTAFRFNLGHHFMQIPFHACLFSEESLHRWSQQMGFKYCEERELPGSDVGYYYVFEKTRSL